VNAQLAPRRSQRARQVAIRRTTSTVPGSVSDLTVYRFSRRTADVILCAPVTPGVFTMAGPPGYSGSLAFVAGSSVGEPDIGTQAYYVPWYSQFAMNTLSAFADLQALFQEYRIRNLTLEVQMISNPVAAQGAALVSDGAMYPLVPELILVENDTGSNLAMSLVQALAYQGSHRQCLDDTRCHRFQGTPKPTLLCYGPGGNEYAMPSSNRGVWFNWVTSPDVPHYLFQGIVRNFASVNAGNNLGIRFSAVVDFDCRRPY
jgi:hypothetical protein